MNLQQRQEKIQAKRKQTSWRDFLREIVSRYPLNMYKNNGLISVFPPNERSWAITWLTDYIQNHDDILESNNLSTWNFLQDFADFFVKHTKPSSVQFGNNENSEYGHCVFRAKNVYLSFVVWETSEKVFYSSIVYQNCTNVYNSLSITDNATNIYASKGVANSYNIYFSNCIDNSSDVRFGNNLIWCHFCINCSNLENCTYYIDNKPVTKDQYRNNMDIVSLGNNCRYHKWVNRLSKNVNNWEAVLFSENIENWYFVLRLNQWRNVCYIEWVNGCEKFYDVFEAGINSNNFYGVCNGGTNSSHVYCSSLIDQGSSNIFYSYHMESCSFCLWCIWLKNKSYCILNKQYTKEERYEKVDEIFWQMEKDWQLWEFFPATMNPFYFNDTAAYLIDPSFTKEEVTKLWYLRRDEPIKVDIPEGAITVQSSELGQFEWRKTTSSWTIVKDLPQWWDSSFHSEWREWKLDDTVCKRVIIDEHGDAYRIIPMELEFLQKHGLPLPRKHRLTRMKESFRIS